MKTMKGSERSPEEKHARSSVLGSPDAQQDLWSTGSQCHEGQVGHSCIPHFYLTSLRVPCCQHFCVKQTKSKVLRTDINCQAAVMKVCKFELKTRFFLEVTWHKVLMALFPYHVLSGCKATMNTSTSSLHRNCKFTFLSCSNSWPFQWLPWKCLTRFLHLGSCSTLDQSPCTEPSHVCSNGKQDNDTLELAAHKGPKQASKIKYSTSVRKKNKNMIAHVWRHPTHTRTHNVRSIFVCVTLALKWEGNLCNKIGWLWYVLMKSCVKDAWPHGPMAYEHKWRKQTLHSMLRPWRSPMSHFCSSGNGGSIELHESHESLFVSAPCLSMFVRFFFPYALCTHSALWLQFFSQKKNTMTGKAPSLLWITAKAGHLRLPANSSNMDTCDVFCFHQGLQNITLHCTLSTNFALTNWSNEILCFGLQFM